MEKIRKYIAEFIGTGVLVFGGCGTAAAVTSVFKSDGMTPGIVVAIALAFGLSIVAMAYSIGNVSGCHINPAVSLGVFINGGMEAVEFAGYVVAQILGGIAGGAALRLTFGGDSSLGTNGYGDLSAMGVGMKGAFVIEVILTFIFILTILGVTSKVENGAVAGIVIALTLVFVHLIGIPFTGTSVNPARSLGPAIFKGGDALGQVWLFIIAPLVGAAIAALVHRFVLSEEK